MHIGLNLQSKVAIQTSNTWERIYTTTVWLSETQ